MTYPIQTLISPLNSAPFDQPRKYLPITLELSREYPFLPSLYDNLLLWRRIELVALGLRQLTQETIGRRTEVVIKRPVLLDFEGQLQWDGHENTGCPFVPLKTECST